MIRFAIFILCTALFGRAYSSSELVKSDGISKSHLSKAKDSLIESADASVECVGSGTTAVLKGLEGAGHITNHVGEAVDKSVKSSDSSIKHVSPLLRVFLSTRPS